MTRFIEGSPGQRRGRPPARDAASRGRLAPAHPRRPGHPGPLRPAPDRGGVPRAGRWPAACRSRPSTTWRPPSGGASSWPAWRRRCELRPCHNDLLNANFIDDGARIRIVDWEYAGMGDPFFDLGQLQHQPRTDARTRTRSCWPPTTARRPSARPDRLARLTLMRVVSDFREAMWGVLQQGISTLDVDFVAYAGEHFDRLLANARRPPSSAPCARPPATESVVRPGPTDVSGPRPRRSTSGADRRPGRVPARPSASGARRSRVLISRVEATTRVRWPSSSCG